MNKIRIGVTGTGSLIGQAVIKSIRRSQINEKVVLVGMDFFKGTVGSYWVDTNYDLPDLLSRTVTKADFIARVEEIIVRERLDFLFIGVDFELQVFAEHRDRLLAATGCRVLVSDPAVIEIARDKYRTYQFLVANDLDAPASWPVAAGGVCPIGFPCVIKPRVGQRSRGVSIVRNEEEMRAAASALETPLVQELVGDPATEYTCGVVCLGGDVRTVISLRRDLKEGNTWAAYYDGANPTIDNYVRKAAARLRPHGACNFQLRVDRHGRPKLFEINARHSGTTYMRALFGFNEVEYILRALLNEPLPDFQLRPGMVKRYYDEMFIPST